MAYIKTEEVKQIRDKLKKEFPDIKWSVVRDHYSSIDVSIMKSKIDFSDIQKEGYFSINHYWLDRLPQKHQTFFKKVIDIIKNASDRKWFDKSDSITDYFHTAFYFNIYIGKYQKPYIKLN